MRKLLFVILLVFCCAAVCSAAGSGADAAMAEGSELLYYPAGQANHFLLRIVSSSEIDGPYYYYPRSAIAIKDRQKGEAVYSTIRTYYRSKDYVYHLFAWGTIVGKPEDFAGRLLRVRGSESHALKFDRVRESKMALFICAEAGWRGNLGKLSAFKTLADELNEEADNWTLLLSYLEPAPRPGMRRGGPDLDLYSVFTGISAIRETLQTDVNLQGGGHDERVCRSNQRVIQGALQMYNMDNAALMEKLDLDLLREKNYLRMIPECPRQAAYYLNKDGTVRCPVHGDLANPKPDANYKVALTKKIDVRTLKGPAAPSHDWKKMVKNPKLQMPAAYSLIPADCVFVHFPSYKAFRQAFDFFEDWAMAFGAAFGGDSGKADFNLEEKIKNQLLLKTDILTRLFADVVLSDIVFLSEDPFFFEGTAFALVLKIENEAMLQQKLALTASEFCRDFPQIKESLEEISGHKVQAFTSPDFKFRSYRLIINGHQIVCNSTRLLEKIIAVSTGKFDAMTDNFDLHYFYEHVQNSFAEPGRIFTFLSDAFIRKLIGPAYKIAARRRLECLCQTLLQNYELLINGKLNPGLVCPEGGKYSFSEGRISCSQHRRFGYLRPLNEALPKEVSVDEAESYGRFVAQYNQYFTQFFDPIGFVFSTNPTFKARLLIMPLVEKGVYSELQKNVKTEPMLPGPGLKNGILKFGANLKVDNLPMPLMWSRNSAGNKKAELIRRWFTGSIWIHMADHPLLLHFDSNFFARGILESLGGGTGRGADMLGFVPAVVSFISPMMFALQLKDEKFYPEIVELLQYEIAEKGQQRGGFLAPDVRLEKLVENGIEMHVLAIDLFAVKKTFYLTCRDGFLLLASKKEVFYQLEKAEEKAMAAGNFNFFLYPKNMKLMRPDLIEMRARSLRQACLENLKNIHLISSFKPEETAAYYHLVFGAMPNCPAGGHYSLHQPAACSVHGSVVDGVIQSLPDFMNGINSVSVQSFVNSDGFKSEISIDQDK